MKQNPGYIQIIGARGRINSKEQFLAKASDFISGSPERGGLLLQFLNADLVCGKQHLQTAIEHSRRAFLRGNAISDSLAMEILLYAAGEVQISSALEKMGISDGCVNVACIIDPGIDTGAMMTCLDLIRDDSVLECTEEKLFRFGITKESIAAAGRDAMADLVLERVSMVDVKK